MKETAGPSRGIGGRTASSSQEEALLAPLLAPLPTAGSHSVLRNAELKAASAAFLFASFLARFLRPRAFFPLGIVGPFADPVECGLTLETFAPGSAAVMCCFFDGLR